MIPANVGTIVIVLNVETLGTVVMVVTKVKKKTIVTVVH